MRSWLAERSIEAVRAALADVVPDIADLPIVLDASWVETGDPLWARSTAFVAKAWVVKFAWSESAAVKLEREIQLLRTLGRCDPRTHVRAVHSWSIDPVLLISPFEPGEPLTAATIATFSPAQKAHLASGLADVLAGFHDQTTRDTVRRATLELPAPTPQADTTALRERLEPILDARRRDLVRGWCDWVDIVLTADAERVVLHGDFHGYNLVIDETPSVRLVLDLETASYGDYHYDFRYLPAQEATLELLLATIGSYHALTQRPVSLSRVMAWHVRTVLGDALWRTEAGVKLPDNGTPTKWVDELNERLKALQVMPT